jgi:hypothetical protein
VIALVIYRRAQAAPTYARHIGLDAVDECVRHLLRSAGRAPVLILEREGAAGILQITAAGRGPDRTLELGVPEVDWSGAYFDDLDATLRASGFAPQSDGGSKCSEVRRYLRVPVSGTTTELAAEGARLVAVTARVLQWPADVQFTAHVERT